MRGSVSGLSSARRTGSSATLAPPPLARRWTRREWKEPPPPGASGETIEERAELEFAEERGPLLPVVPLVTAAGIQVELDGDVPHDRRQLAAQLGYVAGRLQFVTGACGEGVG